jgi:3',5'-cyclic AMP phosphodiesterase CpdA
MLIAQITDLHIRPGEEGKRNDRRLAQVVDRLLDIAPDLVIATGDLTDHGDAPSYRRLRALLAPLPMPVLLAPGNHDLRDPMLAVFPDTPVHDGHIHYAWDAGVRRIILLDTLEEGAPGGHFGPGQAQWLDAQLAAAPDRPTLIALHHPPVDSGIAWLDAQSPRGWAAGLEAVALRHPQIQGFLCGHIHRAVSTHFAGRPLIIASSTAPQVALDLVPSHVSQVEGRPLIVDEPPAFALHRWTATGIVTHFAVAGDIDVIAHYQDERPAQTGAAEAWAAADDR